MKCNKCHRKIKKSHFGYHKRTCFPSNAMLSHYYASKSASLSPEEKKKRRKERKTKRTK